MASPQPLTTPGEKVRRPAPSSTTWPRRALVLATVAMSLASGTSLAILYLQARHASDALVRGQGDAHLDAIQEALGNGRFDVSAFKLSALLARFQPAGVRYIGVFDDRQGGPIEAGIPAMPIVGRPLPPDHPERVGDRVRTSRAMTAEGGPRELRPGGPPAGMPPTGREQPPLLVIEFDPSLAAQVENGARLTLLIGIPVLAALIALSVVVLRLLRHREELALKLEQDRHLRALGEMSAVLAHEIRNPLASLKGHAQLLGEGLAEGSREHNKAKRVISEAVRLETLTKGLLAFVKSGAIHRREADAAKILRDAAELIADPRIRITFDGAPARWSLDPDRMQQVLTNVLVNAVQASPEGGAIEADVRRGNRELHYVVRDHGSGIPRGQEEQIFEPFHTTKTRGTGLGLAISRRIVAAHGGTMTASNHPQGGAVFQIVLPEV